MPPRKASSRAKGKGKAPNVIPDVFQEMLAEALPAQSSVPERPLKKRRVGPKDVLVKTNAPKAAEPEDEVDDDDIQFEDVLEVDQAKSENGGSSALQQTAYRDSDDEDSEGSDHDWDALDFDLKDDDEPSGDLELTLTKKDVPQFKSPVQRRRLVGKDEKIIRLQVHKMHVLCLLSFLERRNEWCNDAEVKRALKPLLEKKTIKYLRPSSELSQFGQANSLKTGIESVSTVWRTRYKITTRGMRRALWAEDEVDLQNCQLPEDADTAYEKSDFREAAKTLKGSRDTAAQLYCALLRSVGVETRLVCSLQPLSFTTGGPSMPKPPVKKVPKTPISKPIEKQEAQFEFGTKPVTALTSRQRLGHPMAADYNIPSMSKPSTPSTPKPRPLIESPFPVFWVEVFDTAHQKWFPVDPLVTESHSKPKVFEPPASDRENALSYVLAFEEDGTARDVTKRYAKAYNAKTRKQRVESTHQGDRWWRKAMRPYRRGFTTDADQIEDTELAAAEAREPMPKNITDFKDHPYYALERHLKRNEVLVSTKECGKVAAGRDASKPGGKKLESVFRRKDVKVARSADKWYRLGRDIKIGEIPIKTVEPKKRVDAEDVGEEDRAGTNLYTEEQTELYIAPPVVDGRVPRNTFGNIDVYVPSMVPAGGVHVLEDEAVMAARILGIDYSPALTGFKFKGRHGTPVLKGCVVAEENKEAVDAVVEGIRDEVVKAEDEARTLRALSVWKKFLIGLRIKERVDGYADPNEDEFDEAGEEGGAMDLDSEVSDEYVDDDFGGGGFMVE